MRSMPWLIVLVLVAATALAGCPGDGDSGYARIEDPGDPLPSSSPDAVSVSPAVVTVGPPTAALPLFPEG